MLRIPALQLILLLFLFSPANAQKKSCRIFGRVTDSVSLEPIPNVSVFIPFTSHGTLTDSNGEYALDPILPGDIQLSFRHMAYAPKIRDLTINQEDRIQYDAALKPVVIEISEVTKQVSKVEWVYGLILFKEMVLGDPYESSCVLKNPRDLFFYRDGDIISGYSREPLRISNTYLGYDITYYLDYFRFDKNKNPEATYAGDEYFSFGGLALYSDKGAHARFKKTKWARNRKAEFQVSLKQLLKDLYQDSLQPGKIALREVTADGTDSIFYWNKEQPEGRFIRYSRDKEFIPGDSVLINGPGQDQKTLLLSGPVLVFFNYLNTPEPSDDRVCLLEADQGILVFNKDGNCMAVNGNMDWIFLDNKKLLRNLLPLDYDPDSK